MSTPRIYKLGGMDVYDVNGVPHSVLTRAPIGRNKTTGQPNKIYKLGGANVYDVNGVPHYASTNKPVLRDSSGKPRNVYKLGGQEVYDIDNKPYYASAGEPLQHNDQGVPTRGRIETERENINKVRQKGTVLSPMAGANEALRKLGVTTVGYGKFQSNHLPGSDYSPEVGKALSKIYDTETLHKFDGSVNDLQLSEDLFMDGSGVKGDGPFYGVDTAGLYSDDVNPINKLQAEGSPFLIRNGDSPITSIVESPNKLGTRARYDEEFLNTDRNTMSGLRAAEASKGLLYASGQHWYENPKYGQEGEKDYLKIDEDVFKAIKNSDMNAQDFFESKLAEIKGE